MSTYAAWKSLTMPQRNALIADHVLGKSTAPKEELMFVAMVRDKLQEDYPSAIFSFKKLPRSTLSLVSLEDNGEKIEAPAMPEKAGMLYCVAIKYGLLNGL